MAKSYNIHQAKTELSKIILLVEKNHETIQICRNGVPVAEVRPLLPKRTFPKQSKKLAVKIIESPVRPLKKQDWGDLI